MIADGPIAPWRLGETGGATAADETGNGHTESFKGPCRLAVPGAIGDGNTVVESDGNATALSAPTIAAHYAAGTK